MKDLIWHWEIEHNIECGKDSICWEAANKVKEGRFDPDKFVASESGMVTEKQLKEIEIPVGQ